MSAQPMRQPVQDYDVADDVQADAADDEPTWWLRLTSSGWDIAGASLEEREMTRRSRLLSWIALGLLLLEPLLMLVIGRGPVALVVAGVALVATLGALALNRAGFVTAAGTLLVAVVIAALAGVVVLAPGRMLDVAYLPAYYLLAVAVLIAAATLSRGAALGVAAVTIALICGDFFVQPKGADLLRLQQSLGRVALLAPPIALQVIVAAIGYLWARGTEWAVRRADRAEEIAALQRAFAEQRRQLDYGVRQILETHMRAANGDFGARAPLNRDNALWQIASSLNNLLNRLQRSGLAEHQLRRTEDEIRRLASALDDAAAGRSPMWPAASGTATDLLIERVAATQRAATASFAVSPAGLPMLPGPMTNTGAMPVVSAVHPAVAANGQASNLPPWLRDVMGGPQTPPHVAPASGALSGRWPRVEPGAMGTDMPALHPSRVAPEPVSRVEAPTRPVSRVAPHSPPYFVTGEYPALRAESFAPAAPMASQAPSTAADEDWPDLGVDWPAFLRAEGAGAATVSADEAPAEIGEE